MLIKNNVILNIYNNVFQSLEKDCSDIQIPVKIGFFLQKNLNKIKESAFEIEQLKILIGKKYGKITDDGMSYLIPEEKMQLAQQDLNDLLEIEQDIPLHLFKLNDFNNISLPFKYLSILSIMIEEE